MLKAPDAGISFDLCSTNVGTYAAIASHKNTVTASKAADGFISFDAP